MTLPVLPEAVETAIAQCTSRWAMVRKHRLNTSIVLAAVHGLSGLFRAVSAVEPSLFRPLPSLSPSLITHLASVDVKQNGPTRRVECWYTSTETVGTITDGEPRTDTSTFTQPLSSDTCCSMLLYAHRDRKDHWGLGAQGSWPPPLSHSS